MKVTMHRLGAVTLGQIVVAHRWRVGNAWRARCVSCDGVLSKWTVAELGSAIADHWQTQHPGAET